MSVTLVTDSRLDELAETITREHEACREALGEALAHAIAAGEALLEARRQMGRTKDWMVWMRGHLPEGLSASTACTYMRFAEHKAVLLGEGVTTRASGLRLLQTMGLYLSTPMGVEKAAHLKTEALRLRETGMTRQAVADELDIMPANVWYWENPERAKETKASVSAARKALKRQEREQEAKRLAKLRGGDIAKLYAESERLQDTLGAAHSQMTDREGREALSLAGEHYRKMRDQIVCALGVAA